MAHAPKGSPRVLLGAEVLAFEGIERLPGLEALRLEGTRLLLLEMPFTHWSERLLDSVEALADNEDFRIVLAHVDRYDKAAVERLFQRNRFLGQVNTDSFKKIFGTRHLREWARQGRIVLIQDDGVVGVVPTVADGPLLELVFVGLHIIQVRLLPFVFDLDGVQLRPLLLEKQLGVLPVGALGDDDAGQDDRVHRQEQEKVYGLEVNRFFAGTSFHVEQYSRLSARGKQFFAYLLEYFCEQGAKGPPDEGHTAEKQHEAVEPDLSPGGEHEPCKKTDLQQEQGKEVPEHRPDPSGAKARQPQQLVAQPAQKAEEQHDHGLVGLAEHVPDHPRIRPNRLRFTDGCSYSRERIRPSTIT